MAFSINDLALCFIGTDPKQMCSVYSNDGRRVHQGRIETLLYASIEPIAGISNKEVDSLVIDDCGEEGYPDAHMIIRLK